MEKWEKSKVKEKERNRQGEHRRLKEGVVEKQERLDWERSLISKKKGLEKPNYM